MRCDVLNDVSSVQKYKVTTHFRRGLELISRMDRLRQKRMESGISSRAAARRD